MRTFLFHFLAHARVLFAALLGLVLGTALQLQQGQLFAWQGYAAIVALAPVIYACNAIKNAAIAWRWALAALALGLLGFGPTGLRATG